MDEEHVWWIGAVMSMIVIRHNLTERCPHCEHFEHLLNSTKKRQNDVTFIIINVLVGGWPGVGCATRCTGTYVV